MSDIAEIAAKLTDARRAYIAAVAASTVPYEPRHNRAANWALKCGIVVTVVEVNGKIGTWDDFTPDPMFGGDASFAILGRRLTPLGLALCKHLEQS